jgi:hypothetical protein
MSQPTDPPWTVLRPTMGDFFLLVGGGGLSHFLMRLGALRVEPGPHVEGALLRDLVAALPDLLRLPEGIILLWPLFLLGQRLRGRSQGLSAGEWLWVFAWLGTVVLTGLTAWVQGATVPEALAKYAAWLPALQRGWYVIFVPAMALVALLLTLIDRILRWQQPWTHQLALVLALWPALPLAGILALGKFVD